MTTPPSVLRRVRGCALGLALTAVAGFAQSNGSPSAAGSGASPAATTTPAIKLEAVNVLGSHIPSTDIEGISPVTSISQGYIQASGFLSTSELLNSFAQIYSGAGAGRGSVPNMDNPASGTTSFAFDFSTYAPDIGQSGVSGVSLGGLGGADTLVLINGRRAPTSAIGNETNSTNASFFDVATIPIGMIDHIEILPSGASAIYGADAVAGVINIVLKKHYTGTELSTTYKTSQHGGGTEYGATLSSGMRRNRFDALVMLDYHRSDGLRASQRPFSASANHTAQGGSDLRLTYGFPATVESVSSGFFGAPPLNGVTDANGNPVTIAFVPTGQDGTHLTPSQFIGLTTPTGKYYPYTYNPRAFDPAPYISILQPSRETGARVHLDYTLKNDIKLYAESTFSRTTSHFDTTPPSFSPGGGFSFGPSIVVPASDPDNPFGQAVTIGMTDINFGPRVQSVRTDAFSYLAGAQGKIGQNWNWDASVSYAVQQFRQEQTNLDINLINATFSNPNASQRYNPFVGEFSASNAALYPSLTHMDTVEGFSGLGIASVDINGQPFELPGGKLGTAFGAEFDDASNHSTTTTDLFYDQRPYTSQHRNSYAVYGEVAVPLFGKPNRRTLFDRLDLQLAGRYDAAGPFHKATPKAGFVWEPARFLMLRGTYSQGFRAPSLTEYDLAPIFYSPGQLTIVDPFRLNNGKPETNNNFTEEQGSNPNIQPETSDNYGTGFVISPPFLKGLSFGADYSLIKQRDIIQNLSDQQIVNNEAAFPGRVVRGPIPAGDTNPVGPITFIDARMANFGTINSSQITYHVDYTLPWQQLGAFTLHASVVRTLTFQYELTPGQPYQSQIGDTAAPPVWKGVGNLRWQRGNWTAILFAYYTGPFGSNASNNALDYEPGFLVVHEPSFTTFDLNIGYQFSRPIWHGYGRNLRVALGVQNIGDKYPPFSNSIFGYDGNYSPLGRSFTLQFTFPL